MDNFNELLLLCKCEVSITVNTHTSFYQTIKEYLRDQDEEVDSDVLEVMIEKNSLVCVQAYPDTPIGFYVVYHHDVAEAILQVLTAIKAERG